MTLGTLAATEGLEPLETVCCAAFPMPRNPVIDWKRRNSVRQFRLLLSSALTAALVTTTAVIALPSPASAATTTYKATIKRTSYGVPHISATDLGSAAFGQGWAYAEDRFCDLMDQVIKVRSQRAKFFGAGPDFANLITDYGYLQLGVMDLARQQNAQLSTEERQILDGYVAGFNGLLTKVGAAHVPGWCAGQPWVGPITAVDVLAYERDLALLASGDNLLAPAFAAQPPGSAVAFASVAPQVRQGVQQIRDFKNAAGTALGSNGWALGADKSQTGKGLLLANPHFPWEGELRFWESQVTVPGNLNVYGASLGGLPGVQIGFTDKVAWTHTISTGTRFTFYLMTLDGDATHYLVDGQREAMTSKTFTIQVKQPDGTLAPVSRTLYSTRYGPVLDLSSIDPSLGWTDATAISYRDANITNDKMLHQWFNIARAADTNGINAAVAGDQGIPWVNVIATDAKGNAYYADPSQTPLLTPDAQAVWASPDNPLGLLDGSSSAFAWQNAPGQRSQGLVPFSQQPKLTRRDYTFNANDSHYVPNANQQLVGFNLLQGPEGTPLTVRSRQNVKLIEATAKFSVAAIGAALYGDTSFTSDQLTSAVAASCRGTITVDGSTVNLNQPATVLQSWDRRFDPASRGAILWRETVAAVIAANPGSLTAGPAMWGVPFSPGDPAHTPRGVPTNRTPLCQGLARATLLLQSRGIPLNAPLSQLQYTVKNGVKIPVPGSNENVGIANAVYYQFPGQAASSTSLEPGMDLGTLFSDKTDMTTKGYPVNYGTSFVLTMGFTTAGPSAKALLTFGESANPASPNFSDQTRLFSNKQLRDAWFTDAQISGDTKSIEVLVQVTIG
jgi:acyl-homoserine-lactone acylase